MDKPWFLWIGKTGKTTGRLQVHFWAYIEFGVTWMHAIGDFWLQLDIWVWVQDKKYVILCVIDIKLVIEASGVHEIIYIKSSSEKRWLRCLEELKYLRQWLSKCSPQVSSIWTPCKSTGSANRPTGSKILGVELNNICNKRSSYVSDACSSVRSTDSGRMEEDVCQVYWDWAACWMVKEKPRVIWVIRKREEKSSRKRSRSTESNVVRRSSEKEITFYFSESSFSQGLGWKYTGEYWGVSGRGRKG